MSFNSALSGFEVAARAFLAFNTLAGIRSHTSIELSATLTKYALLAFTNIDGSSSANCRVKLALGRATALPKMKVTMRLDNPPAAAPLNLGCSLPAKKPGTVQALREIAFFCLTASLMPSVPTIL